MSKQRDYTTAYQPDMQTQNDDDFTDETFEIETGMLPAVNQALAVQGDGTIQVGRFTLTRIGFRELLPSNRAEWGELGDFLTRLNGSLQWLIGDWLVCGEDYLKIGKVELAAMVDRDLHTFENYAWVARSLPYSLRRESLSFGHHMLVAGLESDREKVRWLDSAQKEKWSIGQMRAAMKGKSQPKNIFDDLIDRGIKLRTEVEKRDYIDTLRRAADELERSL